jgi:pSer/pThr/pTyr-binding forkhead associated (FHA) protein
VRPTDDARNRTLAQLRESYAAGSLETDTFSVRIDRALRTRSEHELRGLTSDLPAPSRWRRALERLTATLAPAPAGLLANPGSLENGRITLGRSSACQLVLTDDTVSRRHAALVVRDGAWRIVDLGSSNGTWVNGRRVVEAEVRPGDDVRLGAASLRL